MKTRKGHSLAAMLACWVLAAVWIGVAFYLSCQQGEETTQMSLSLTQQIAALLAGLLKGVSQEALHGFVRTAAHVALFGVMGVMLSVALVVSRRALGIRWRWSPLAVLALGTLVGVMTEVVKTGIPGRHLHWHEALLNVVSLWLGMGVVGLWRLKKQK